MSGIPPVVIDFATRGLTDVSKAFETVEQRIARMEKNSTAKSVSESRIRVRTAKSETDEREKAYAKLVKQIERDEQRATKVTEREAKKAANASISEAKRVEKETARSEAEKLRMRARALEMAGRYAAKQAAEEIRLAERKAEAEERAAGRSAAASERAAARSQRAWGRTGKLVGGSVTGAMGSLAGSAFGAASMALGIGGGVLAVDAVHRELSAERSAALLVNQVTVGGKPPDGASVANILGQASQVSQETGMSKEQLIEGTRAYAKTARGGDFGGAMANMGFFAKMSKVTGVDMGEIAGAAGMLQSQNAALAADPKKMQQMLLDVLAQTKNGSMGMTQAIAQAGKIGSVRSAFQGDESVNQRKLMALGQLVAPAAGDESGIMIKDLALEATKGKHLAQAKAMGVHFDKLNRMESPEQAIQAVLRSSGGDISKIEEVFGSRGGTLLRELSGGYAAARAAGGPGKKGIEAGDKYLSDTIGSVANSTMSGNDLNAQFEQMMSTPAERFQTALNKVIDTLENKAEPFLNQFADKIGEAAPMINAFIEEFESLLKAFANDPIAGIGKALELAIAAEVVKAGIGALLDKAFSTRLGGGVAIAAAALEIGMATIDIMAEAEKGRQKKIVADTNESVNLASKLHAEVRGGTVSAADVKAAQEQAIALSAEVERRKADVAKPGSILGVQYQRHDIAHQNDVAELKNFQLALKALTDVLPAAAAGIKTLGGVSSEAANGVKGNPARNNPINERNPTGS